MSGPSSSEAFDALGRHGLAAAIEVAQELGLEVDRPQVLSNEQNLLVHLRPSSVVARVATRIAWSRPDPAAWLAREVAVAAHAARNGGPVVPAAGRVDPGPHTKSGLVMTLWAYVETMPQLATEAEVGESLAQLHLSLRDFPSNGLPDRLPVHAQIENGLSALQREAVIDVDTLEELKDRHAALSRELGGVDGTPGVIHGDAHPWNLLRTAAGWRWVDLEETGFGPQEFDLAVLASKVEDPDAALAAYASVMRCPAVRAERLVPFQRVRELESVVWELGMAVMDASYSEGAQDRLQRLLRTVP